MCFSKSHLQKIYYIMIKLKKQLSNRKTQTKPNQTKLKQNNPNQTTLAPPKPKQQTNTQNTMSQKLRGKFPSKLFKYGNI